MRMVSFQNINILMFGAMRSLCLYTIILITLDDPINRRRPCQRTLITSSLAVCRQLPNRLIIISIFCSIINFDRFIEPK